LLAQAAKSVASYQVRNRATLTGNLCNASPCADTSPAALVLEGEALLYGPAGSRRVSLSAFWTGPGQTSLGPAEFAVAVRFPVPPAGAVGRYLKLGRRKAGDLAVVGVAALAYADPELPSGYRFRLGLGSVGPVVFRAVQAEEHLAGEAPGDASFARAAEAAASASAPISDVRATAEYQRRMVRVLTLRALRDVWGQFEAAQAGERGA
jgi:carbon-monoxide dehydrogenase medium subunit